MVNSCVIYILGMTFWNHPLLIYSHLLELASSHIMQWQWVLQNASRLMFFLIFALEVSHPWKVANAQAAEFSLVRLRKLSLAPVHLLRTWYVFLSLDLATHMRCGWRS